MPYYRRVGEVPTTRHAALRDETGAVRFEELMGEEGFAAESSLLYHRFSPSAVVAVHDLGSWEEELRPNEPLQPRHFRTRELDRSGDLVTDRMPLLGNDDLVISYAVASLPSTLYRNAVGDELVFVQRGTGALESVFGRLDVAPGDYVVVPCGVTHRWVPAEGETIEALVLDASGHIRPPAHYLTAAGQLVEQAPYCERDLRGPAELLAVDGEEVPVLVRHRGGRTRYTYAHHPFDVVGWDGWLYPWALNVADLEPVAGRAHQPAAARQTFEAPGFGVHTTVPHSVEVDPGTVRAPYHHANVDRDELVFHSAGSFAEGTGAGIGIGSITLHPAGFVYGPPPGTEVTGDRDDHVAVLVDTARPLGLFGKARAIDDKHYWRSWAKAEEAT